jgi:hypothetical protein
VTNGMGRRSGGARPGAFLGALALVLVALFVPGALGAVLLLAVVAALASLMTRTWPVAPPQTRALRLLVLLILLGVALFKFRH